MIQPTTSVINRGRFHLFKHRWKYKDNTIPPTSKRVLWWKERTGELQLWERINENVSFLKRDFKRHRNDI